MQVRGAVENSEPGYLTRGERRNFIGGAPRSGSTLVQNMLDSHPDICGAPELLHLRDIIDLRRKLHSSIELGWIDIICSHEDVDQLTASLVEGLLLPLADRQGCRLVSEKTPPNFLVFPELLKQIEFIRQSRKRTAKSSANEL